MDYLRIRNDGALGRVCGRGVPGSAVLREAMGRPQPLFARARSPFEIKLIVALEETNTPLPEINEEIGDITPDAVWRDQMVVVQCDGRDNHDSWAQRQRDMREDKALRGLGYFPIRYTYEQLDDPWAIHADLMPILEERRGRAAKWRLSA
jgi:hypothetical protein